MSVFDAFSLRGPGAFREFLELFSARPFECLQVEVTSHCPGKCVYCPHTTNAATWQSMHMEPAIFAALWPLMRQARRVHLQGWGEPFLHPHFFEFVALARRAGCRVSTTTCGLRMDDAFAERLVDCGVDIIAFSLTGTDEASNAARQGVPFARVAHAVSTLQRIRKKRQAVHLEVHLAYLLLASNMAALEALPTLMQQWGVHGAVISTLDHVPHPDFATEGFLPHEREKIAIAKAVIQRVVAAAPQPVFASLPGDEPAPQCRERVCERLYVSVDGAISPCVYLNIQGMEPEGRLVFGQLPHDAAEEVWHTPAYVAFRQGVGTGMPHPACAGCPKRFEETASGV